MIREIERSAIESDKDCCEFFERKSTKKRRPEEQRRQIFVISLCLGERVMIISIPSRIELLEQKGWPKREKLLRIVEGGKGKKDKWTKERKGEGRKVGGRKE